MRQEFEVKTARSKLPPRGWKKVRRFSSAGPKTPRSRLRRAVGWVFNPWSVSLALTLLFCGFLVCTYYWFEFSDRIDRRLLAGEVYTPSAGIYSAPKTLKIGEESSSQSLIEYLKSAGYVEKNDKADQSRSRFWMDGDALQVEPGYTAVIDGKRIFPNLTVRFRKDGKSVASITEPDSGRNLEQARLEPRMLSTIAAEGDGRRKVVTFDDLPQHLIKAITVTEDRSFFEHYGVNFRGIARALWRRYDQSDDDSPLSRQGGSSITQQLVKNLLLTNDPTLERKITEAYMSVILETRLSKQEIFNLYANQIYLGQQSGVSIYGVGEASDAYFGKDVSQLTLPEAAFIAGIIRSPNRYNPYKNIEKVTERRNQVLESMREAGEIDDQLLAQARQTPVALKKISNRKDLQGMPYFSQYATDELQKIVGDPEAVQHLRAYTSIDPDLQRIAYETVAKRLDMLDKHFPKVPKGTLNAALVAVRPKTGEIVAMVGGRDYLQNQFNRATDAMRQPGSVFKPFVYATAINSPYEGGSRIFTPASIFKDEKKTFTFGNSSYSPGNFGDFFSNQDLTLRDALVKSKNVITVDLGMQLNIGRVMNLAAKAGMPKVEHAYPSMALGTAEATPLQVATAYTTFANLGDRVMPMPITLVTAGDGRTVTAPAPDRKNVIRSDVAFVMDDILKDVINRGTAAQAQNWGLRNVSGKTAFAGKTGTSRDGWFAGFTPELVCVVYVGFDDGSDLGMKGGDSALPIWADFMKEAVGRNPDWNGDWPMPGTVRKAEIDIRDGSVIRELNPTETPKDLSEKSTTGPSAQNTADPNPEITEEVVKNVPPEFRRIELFIAGTLPIKSANLEEDPSAEDDPGVSYPEQSETPSPTPTPITGTWEDAQEPPGNRRSSSRSRPDDRETVSVAICPLTGMRATSNCPEREMRTYRAGSEPKEFCTFHR